MNFNTEVDRPVLGLSMAADFLDELVNHLATLIARRWGEEMGDLHHRMGIWDHR
jgi:hypothetical protein